MKNSTMNFEDFILDETFREYVARTNSGSIRYWNEWIESHPENQKEFEKAKEVLKTLINHTITKVPVEKEQALNALLHKIKQQEKSHNIVSYLNSTWMRIAAVIILAIGFASLWNWLSNSLQNSRESAYCEVIVPIGEKSQIILADGTHVWINSGSKFRYPSNFGKKSRNVFLEGEAYFDVTKQNGKEFIVNTRDAKIDVLGTAFNVKCYADETKTQTTVVRGLVKVESLIGDHQTVFIHPKEMAVLRPQNKGQAVANKKDNKLIAIENINPEVVTCWKDQLLVFNDESLGEMIVKMERWYNVKIEINDEKLKAERYTGKFIQNETIYQVLEAIKFTTPIQYKAKNNEVIITRAK
jgi:transmembrane sensor